MQGWVLRRCLSNVNRICGRPYRPKDQDVRALCAAAGVTWPEPEHKQSFDQSEESTFEDEESESEFESDAYDEEVDVGGQVLVKGLVI